MCNNIDIRWLQTQALSAYKKEKAEDKIYSQYWVEEISQKSI
jgi:hypothetical protein